MGSQANACFALYAFALRIAHTSFVCELLGVIFRCYTNYCSILCVCLYFDGIQQFQSKTTNESKLLHIETYINYVADCHLRQGDGGTKTACFGSKTCCLR